MLANVRKRIFKVIEASSRQDKLSAAYDYFQIIVILLSLVPLMFKEAPDLVCWLDSAAVFIFIVDYVLRFITADFYLKQSGIKAFLKYPFTPMAIIDLLSILPAFTPLNAGLRVPRVLRAIRSLRVVRGLKIFRYSKRFAIVKRVLFDSKDLLFDVGLIAWGYILLSALIMFNVEPNSFDTFFEAIYWATILLTTVGYGDIYPLTAIGQLITVVSSVFGIAIVALPSGIITANYMKEMEKDNKGDVEE